jgi:steroid 5-alpha reductase family enzyme
MTLAHALATLGQGALALLVLNTLLWVASVAKRDASLIDPWWSMGFLLVTSRAALDSGLDAPKALILACTAAWALRLFGHLLVRSRGKPEDPRYQAFRRRFGPARYWWVSYFQVFVLQGVLAMMVSAPLQLAASLPARARSLSAFELLGGLVFAAGFAFEWVADRQLDRFRASPANRGTVLDRGLFAWTRHPNYFGETVLQWGLWMMAASSLAEVLSPLAVAATALSPALMTWLLVRVSGVSMLDEHLARTRPGYAEYMRRTSAFVPRPPRA